jgi:hypothetical protein
MTYCASPSLEEMNNTYCFLLHYKHQTAAMRFSSLHFIDHELSSCSHEELLTLQGGAFVALRQQPDIFILSPGASRSNSGELKCNSFVSSIGTRVQV